MLRNNARTTIPVRSVPRHPHRSNPQNSENTKYVKKGLEDGPRLNHWKTVPTAMSPTCMTSGHRPEAARFQEASANAIA